LIIIAVLPLNKISLGQDIEMDPLPLPDAFARFPRTPLLWKHGSPLERLDHITNLANGNVEVWIKRDDCNSGLAFGGNKLRALEYILPDVIGKGCDIVVAEGGTQSNTVRQVAAAAAKKGLEVRPVSSTSRTHSSGGIKCGIECDEVTDK